MRFFHVSDKKVLLRPGAMLAAIIADSMAKVPLPQKGSTRILSFFHGVSIMSAEANVSVMGAFTVCFR